MINEKIRALHSADMEEYLSGLGVLEEVRSGSKVCEVCGKTVTIKNIGCLYPENQQVKFVCVETVCLEAIIKRRSF